MKNLLVIVLGCLNVYAAQAQELSLQGKWTVSLDSSKGVPHAISLPGTLDDAGIGTKNTVQPGLDIAALAHLARKVEFIGKAFYTRPFTVPANWQSKQVTLTLGRVLWKSTVWIDGKPVSKNGESLVAAHQYDITPYITPGKKQTITICVDNSNIYPGINVYAKQYPAKESSEMAHAYTNHTQIKWNGIIGSISLTARPTVSLDNIKVLPHLEGGKLDIQYQVNNPAGAAFDIRSYVLDTKTGKRWPAGFTKTGQTNRELVASIPFAKEVVYWNEFSPQLYQLMTIVQSASGGDTVKTSFGIREFTTRAGDLYLNNNKIFIRGNLECIIFPLKGYPPMQASEWKALFTTAKAYGLNSFRFHSWCPPATAFKAADELGFYLQVELPHWNLKVGSDTASFHFLEREAHRILDTYGNHPSFLFFSMGNELEGDFGKLNNLVSELKKKDNRHLYSTTTFTFQKEITGLPQPQDDYYVTQWTQKGWVRGQGVFNDESPNFSKDYTASTEGLEVPLISHEIGQYSVFPDMNEIAKYKGNLVPQNFIGVRDDMDKKGLLHLAPAYLKATGKFATLLYKEEIERAYKTKGFDGFQLLQLQDFPGQGTALVGLLNAFWESKGAVTAKEFHQYCSELTPLLRFPKAVYTSGETFKAGMELANFYKPLNKAELLWKISDGYGKVLKAGTAGVKDYPVGNCLAAGEISFDLQRITAATRLTIELSVKGTSYRNAWNIWVYPAGLKDNSKDVMITASINEALQALEQGRKVLLCPLPDTLHGIKGKFVPVFWSPVHFPNQPGTMGLLINNHHKALAGFPTADHSDWQWWDLTIRSKTLVADGLPEQAIIVRVIDNFVRNQNLTNLFEAKVGKGSLIFCSMDIATGLDNRPGARQLRHSLLQYMNSPAFKPSVVLQPVDVQKYFK